MSKLIIWIFPAPDAFFWVGTEGSPCNVADVSTTKILAPNPDGWAEEEEGYEYDDNANKKRWLLPFFDNELVTLKMPSNMTVW